eukprot:SAG11_NODE_1858_length_4159_cov_22.716256_3_plen_71_part_00
MAQRNAARAVALAACFWTAGGGGGGSPSAPLQLHEERGLTHASALLSHEECAALIRLAEPLLRRSQVRRC